MCIRDREAAAARVRQAEGAVSEVESYIGDAMVYAPVTGEVSTIIAEQGELCLLYTSVTAACLALAGKRLQQILFSPCSFNAVFHNPVCLVCVFIFVYKENYSCFICFSVNRSHNSNCFQQKPCFIKCVLNSPLYFIC